MGRATQLGVNFAKGVLTNARLGVNFVPDIAPEPHISINLEVGPGKEADVTAQFKTIENFAQRSSSEFYLFVFAKLTEKSMPMMGSTISVSLVAGCISSAQNPEVEREPRFST